MTRVGRSERSDLRHGNPMKSYVSEVATLAPTYITIHSTAKTENKKPLENVKILAFVNKLC